MTTTDSALMRRRVGALKAPSLRRDRCPHCYTPYGYVDGAAAQWVPVGARAMAVACRLCWPLLTVPERQHYAELVLRLLWGSDSIELLPQIHAALATEEPILA